MLRYPIVASCNLERIDIPKNVELSDMDKALAMLHYPRFVPHEEASEWTIEHALDVLGVHGNTRDRILQSRCPKEIYSLFTLWNKKRIQGL